MFCSDFVGLERDGSKEVAPEYELSFEDKGLDIADCCFSPEGKNLFLVNIPG